MSVWYFVLAFVGAAVLLPLADKLRGRWGAYVRLLVLAIAVSSALVASGLLFVQEPWPPMETPNNRDGPPNLGSAARFAWMLVPLYLIVLAGPQVIGALFCFAGLYLARYFLWPEVLLVRRGFYNPGGPDERMRAATKAAEQRMSVATKEVERDLGTTWDRMIADEGRTGPERLTNTERKQLTAIARGQAILVGIAVSLLLAIGKAVELYASGATEEPLWAAPLIGLLAAFFFFGWRKNKLLQRAADFWAAKRAEVVGEEIARRVKSSA